MTWTLHHTYSEINNITGSKTHLRICKRMEIITNGISDHSAPKLNIYTMDYYAVTEKNVFMSFAGTWMKLRTILLNKLTLEQKTKHHILSLLSGSWTMRTYGHREGNITHWGLSVGWGSRREMALEKIPNVDDRLMVAANYHGTCN